MQTVRLSGTITGSEDPNREIRAQMLYSLFAAGWDIYNSNGDQSISLNNIEEKIIESDAFIFMPGATLQDIFKAISIFVGYQTLDPHLHDKATVILNSDNSWDHLLDLLNTLKAQGTIGQDYRQYLLETKTVGDLLNHLKKTNQKGLPDIGREKIDEKIVSSFTNKEPVDIKANICVFCSASIEDPDYLEEGYLLGKLLAENKLGCISGAGKSGVMGQVVAGCIENEGWAAGSNVPHIIELEGLPEGLSEFWLRDDIYTRMEVMIEKSDAFIIFPGGSGTVQEMLALLIFKQLNSPLMQDKPIVIYNKSLGKNLGGFWDKLIILLEPWSDKNYYTVVDNIDETIEIVGQS